MLDAFVTRARTQIPVPQRGSLREELKGFLETAFQALDASAAPIATLLGINDAATPTG